LNQLSFAQIRAMKAFDVDGDGPAQRELYVTGHFGAFITINEVLVHLAKWNGTAWSAVGGGLDFSGGYALAISDEDGAGPGFPGLFIGGRFKNGGTQSSMHFARWGCPNPGACYANCDGSTTPPILNVADFGCFLQKFAGGDLYANCDGSTAPPVLNVADFGCFVQAFAGGCR
jgi:hypothetical protein